ncbi:MFS general substrate transporter [Leucosporidium creatinivorum]|uniref:MFS general substrate transporter n=1 Tax=Leucosporidium creatinivorum TaxID=106004 RepID=A0A1Y2F819_9BASI|nr:MFS general substrate transporter [Leucosporidium creatinivorum]
MATVPEVTAYGLNKEATAPLDNAALDRSEKSSLSSPSTVAAATALQTDVDQKKLLRRIDWRILPFCYWSYMVMRVDVGNISNAGIMNSETGHSLKQELGLTAQQWTWVIASFSYTYMFLEPISTPMVKLYRPSGWITRIMCTWAVITICAAAVKNYAGLITIRVLLGAAEAGYFPCIVYWWSFWYNPQQLAPRILGLYMAGAAAGAASGFLAYAISFTNRPDFAGWRWLFIIEGVIPLITGTASWWLIPDFPSTSKWLSIAEVQTIRNWLHKDSPNEITGHTFSLRETLAIFRDPSYVLFTAFWILHGIGGYGIGLVLPQVIKDLGFTTSAGANLLNIPPAAATILFLCLCSFLLSRRIVNAFPLIIFMDTLVIAGYIILLTRDEPGVRYFALLLVTAAAGVAYPSLWPRRVQALRGTAGAALGIGLHNASAQMSGILGPQLFRSDYGPRYVKPFKAAIGLIAVAIALLVPLWWLLDGDISKSAWLTNHVQSQTHYREGDETRERVEEVLAAQEGGKREGKQDDKV